LTQSQPIHEQLTLEGYCSGMFGPSLGSVFASRWKALWWAASIMLLAYCSVPSADDKPSDPSKQEQGLSPDDIKAAQAAAAAIGRLSGK